MIISARHKCPECGREWMMPVNTTDPELIGREKEMRDGKGPLPTVCDGCARKRSGNG